MVSISLPKKQAFKLALRLGFAIVLPLIIFLFGGYWLDLWRGTRPLFTIIGLGVGFIVTVGLMLWITFSLTKKQNG